MRLILAFLASAHDAVHSQQAIYQRNQPPHVSEPRGPLQESMVEKGVAGEDVQFLAGVLNPDPEARVTVREILESGYL